MAGSGSIKNDPLPVYQRLAIRLRIACLSRGPRRARFWRGGVPTDVHRDSDETVIKVNSRTKATNTKKPTP